MKKFYLLTIIALLGISQASWANTANSADNTSDLVGGQIVIINEHVTFTFSGETISDGGSWGYKLKSLTKGNEAKYSFTWANSSDYTIQVSSIAFEGRGYRWAAGDIGGGKMEFNGVEKQVASIAVTNNDGDYTKFSASGNLSSGMVLTCKNTNTGIGSKEIDYYIRKIAITYTITPNDRPGQTSTAETINVTVNPADLTANAPQTVDLKNVFTVPATFANDREYALTENLNDKGVINNGVFYATAAGIYKAKARIAAKANCHEGTDWTEEITITVNRLEQILEWENEATITENMILGSTQTITAVANSGLTPLYESSNTDVLTVDANGVLTAKAIGTATITASREGNDQYNEAASITKTFNVREKDTPHFTPVNFTTLDSCAFIKGESRTIQLSYVSDDENFTFVSSNENISVSREGNTLTINAEKYGEATLTLSQKETATLNAETKTYKFTVLRYATTITVNEAANFSATIAPGASLAVAFASNNPELDNTSFVVEQLSGQEIATLEEGVISTTYRTGTATWKVSLPQSENYQAAEATFSVTIEPAAEVTDCYVLVENEEHHVSFYTNNSGLSYDLSAPGKTLYVKVGKESNITTQTLYIYGYDEKDVETVLASYGAGDLTTSGEDKEIPISEKIVRIKFQAGGTQYKWFSNVKVTRKTYLQAAAEQINTYIGVEGKAQLVVDYSLANGGDLKIACDNDKFVLSQYTVSDVDCKSGKATIDVSYTSDELIEDVANVVIYNNVYRAEAQLKATVSKLDQVITWTTDSITYGDTIANIASTNVEALTVTYSSSDETVIKVVDNQLVALSAGEAVITATTAETELYNAGESQQTIKVGKLPQEIIWTYEGDTILLVLKEEKDVYLTATSGLYVSLEADNDTVVDITEKYEEDVMVGFTLQALAEGSATLTASQEGDEHYLPATNILKIVVVKSEATGVENVQGDDVQCTKVRKIMHNGQIYIMYNGTMYNVQGHVIR